MMTWITFKRAVALAVGGGTVAGAHAVQCEREDLKEASSLTALPIGIADVLHDQGNGFVVADRGADYQATDVIVGKALPFRRFVLAGVAPGCALVSIGHGDRGYSVELYRLRFTGDNWEVAAKGFTFEVPSSLDDWQSPLRSTSCETLLTRRFSTRLSRCWTDR